MTKILSICQLGEFNFNGSEFKDIRYIRIQGIAITIRKYSTNPYHSRQQQELKHELVLNNRV